ncbi:MFS transporter, CP family, cyanate transporter [Lentibacillus halodurans]|uniref:MFS transporter, CP family, cyanate transporter n=1 Tax=Lentibacillus halodurans TaxID=237679 RepID=A0A1I0WH08_9BACI|nr:MFS transporter [Lentibacillus halodurans]SFA87508.1 MFS transporter, CP family, cyanate transporter [Lentibacillus halodurans]
MTHNESKQLYNFLLVAGIILVAFNLRPAITSVGPLIGIIRDDIGLSNWSAGMLTSLPLIAFAVMSPAAPKLGNRYSNERTLLVGMILLLIGISVRSISVMWLLFTGTLFVGLGIAICNVLLPGVIKEKFPAKVGLMTSVYSTAMGIFAASASGLSIPLAQGFNMGWQLALLVWATPAVLGIMIWIYLSRKQNTSDDTDMKYVSVSDNQMWRSPLAWQVACYMGLQSFLFYVTISWLPEILHDNGLSMATSGWMLSFAQFVGLPASFIVPVVAGRLKSQRSIVLVMGMCALGGYSGLLIGSSFTVMVISSILIGITLSGTFALALALLGMRARNARHAAELSGMAQSLGYTLAAVGPMFIGYLYDLTDFWTIPLMTLIGVAILVMTFGMGAGRDRYVLD